MLKNQLFNFSTNSTALADSFIRIVINRGFYA